MRLERKVKIGKVSIKIKKDMYDRLNLGKTEYIYLENTLITLHKLCENYIFSTDNKRLFDTLNSKNQKEFVINENLAYQILNDNTIRYALTKTSTFNSVDSIPEDINRLITHDSKGFVKIKFRVEYVEIKNNK